MYNPPITLIIDQIHHKLMADMDNHIVQAVGTIGISIDKDELIKALAYDRNQYEQGYADAKLDALNRIVRCEHCKWSIEIDDQLTCGVFASNVEYGFHCAYGKGKK